MFIVHSLTLVQWTPHADGLIRTCGQCSDLNSKILTFQLCAGPQSNLQSCSIVAYLATQTYCHPQQNIFPLGLIHRETFWPILAVWLHTHFAPSESIPLQSCRSGHREGSRSVKAWSGELCPTFWSWPHQRV